MPTSEKQQGAAKAAYGAVKKGAAAVKKLKGPSKEMAKSMSKGELKKMATGPIKKESIKESVEEGALTEGALANNFTFWVVEKPETPTQEPSELFFETDPIGFANQVAGGLMPENISGFYLSEEEASEAAHDEVVAVFEAAKALEEKKMAVTTKIEETIKNLQKEVNRCMEEGLDEKAQMYLQKISELRSKSQMVEASKKPIEEKKDKK